jgi:ketosteroid isomerase-like protein
MNSTNPCKTDIVKSFLETAIARDWKKLATYCHANFTVRESDALPYAGVYRGIEGFRSLARLIFIESFKDFRVEPQHYSEGDDHVVLLAAISGVGKKSGIPFSSHLAEIYWFENDLITEIQPFYWDTRLINDVLVD